MFLDGHGGPKFEKLYDDAVDKLLKDNSYTLISAAEIGDAVVDACYTVFAMPKSKHTLFQVISVAKKEMGV